MPWFRVDDSMPDHPDVLALMETKAGPAAVGLWTLAGCWCSRHLTDGLLTSAAVRRLGFRKAHAEALVSVGLWEKNGNGYAFRNWEKYQPSRQDVEGRREAAKGRMKRFRSREQKANDPDHVREPRPGPARPGPTRPELSSESSPPTMAWERVGAVYARRFEAETTRPVALHLHRPHFEAIALQSGGDLELVERSLAGFWADAWASQNRWPVSAWAKQFERHLEPARPSAADREETLAARRREERKQARAEMEAELAAQLQRSVGGGK